CPERNTLGVLRLPENRRHTRWSVEDFREASACKRLVQIELENRSTQVIETSGENRPESVRVNLPSHHY
ncbi:MAG: hypothetical protein KAQ71_10870, partial [Desulfobulbaceae bacterium]|nr:hypothetical protein [Desulfobulbaceae bacterium]